MKASATGNFWSLLHGAGSESLHVHPPARRDPNWIPRAGRTAGMRRSLCPRPLTSTRESGLKNPTVYFCIYGSKTTPRHPKATIAFSTDALKNLLCLWTQVSPVKGRTVSEFTPTVSHTLLKAHQSNSSEELTNAAQPTNSGHTRERPSICHSRKVIWQLKWCTNGLNEKKAFSEKSTNRT